MAQKKTPIDHKKLAAELWKLGGPKLILGVAGAALIAPYLVNAVRKIPVSTLLALKEKWSGVLVPKPVEEKKLPVNEESLIGKHF